MAHEEKLEKAKDILKEGAEATEKLLGELDKALKRNPWPFLAGAAAVSFFLGFLIRGQKKCNKNE